MVFKIDGKRAESIACDVLQKKGYKILEKNFKTKYGEIDIIAMDKDTLSFVEVKARSSRKFGLPEEAVNQRKLQKIRTVAEIYMKNKSNYKKVKVEVVSLEFAGPLVDKARIILVD